MSRRFRHHDFLLGRRDAQNFLANDFVLPATHPLFGNWADSHRALYANAKGDLPIIPLMNSLRPVGADALALPEWPWGAADMTGFRPALARRLRVLTNALALPWWLRLLLWPLLVGVRGLLTWLGVRLVNGALRAHDIG